MASRWSVALRRGFCVGSAGASRACPRAPLKLRAKLEAAYAKLTKILKNVFANKVLSESLSKLDVVIH